KEYVLSSLSTGSATRRAASLLPWLHAAAPCGAERKRRNTFSRRSPRVPRRAEPRRSTRGYTPEPPSGLDTVAAATLPLALLRGFSIKHNAKSAATNADGAELRYITSKGVVSSIPTSAKAGAAS